MALPDPLPFEIDPEQLARARAGPTPPLVLDVREPHELLLAALDRTVHIPLGDLPARMAELPGDRPIVVICRSGRRSLDAARFLRANGLPRTASLAGGLLAWAEAVDAAMPRY